MEYTANKPNKNIPTNNRFFNERGLFNNDLMKGVVVGKAYLTPQALILGTVLSSFYNNSNAQGSIYANESRLTPFVRLTNEELRGAAQELKNANLFEAIYDSNGNIATWKPLITQWSTELRAFSSKHYGFSMNHCRYLARYADGSVLARAVMLVVLGSMSATYAEMGKKVYIRSGNKQARLKYHALFRHPVLTGSHPATWEMLRDSKLPESSWYEGNSATATLTTSHFLTKLNINESELNRALSEISALGYFTVSKANNGGIRFTAAPKLHNEVWTLDRHPGGANLNHYELQRGFLVSKDDNEDRPQLGYHFLYIISSLDIASGRKTPVIVGETTQSLLARLHQHSREATNGEAYALFCEIMADPSRRLVIDHAQTVHSYNACEAEVALIRQVENKTGVRLLNKVRDAESNRGTIKRDSRFVGAQGWQVKATLDSTYAELGSELEDHREDLIASLVRDNTKLASV